MDADEACRIADAAVFAETGRHLKDVEKFILSGACAGETYELIAEANGYAASYFKKYAGPELWKLLSQALGETVRKTNFREVLGRWAQHQVVPVNPNPHESQPKPPIWYGVPDVPVFFGRTEDLALLERSLVRDRCRFVLLSGMSGMGKTTLAAKLAQQVRDQFECILWRSLSDAPSIQKLLNDLMTVFVGKVAFGKAEATADEAVGSQISLLVECLKQRHSLLILDDLETILRSQEMAGQYANGYQDYGNFFRQLGAESHRSCFMLIGREQPTELTNQAGEMAPVCSHKLKGLPLEEAKKILSARDVSGDQHGAEELIQLYRGNPLALKIVSTTIKDVFRGNISQFMRQNTVLIDDMFRDLLCEQFRRLSELERSFMYEMALADQPVGIDDIKESLRFSIASNSPVMKGLQSLNQRSLIEEFHVSDRASPVFILQPVVKKYVIYELVEKIEQALSAILENFDPRRLGLLKTHALMRQHSPDLSQSYQSRMILIQAIERLQSMAIGDIDLEERLSETLALLEQKSAQTVGYAKTNMMSLLALVGGGLL